MTKTNWVRVLGAGMGVWGLVSLAGTALAQSDSQPSKDQDVLKGPRVRDNSVPGEKGRFSGGKGDRKDRALDRGIPPPMYMRALETLRDEKQPDNVRLTGEQDEKIRGIQRDFMESERSYIQSHRDELAALRADLPPEMRARVDERLRNAKAFEKGLGKEGGKKGAAAAKPEQDEMMDQGKDQPKPDPAKVEKARARLIEIFDGAPKPKDAQSKVWALLTDTQRPVLQAELDRLQKEGPGAGRPGRPELTPEMREKLKNMTPEERQKAIEEMRQGRPGKRIPDGEAKPAPAPSDVNVPKPDGGG